MRDITKGSTDQSTMIRIVNSTTGVPEEAVEHNSSGISLWYRREGGSVTAITPAALAAANSAHSDGGIEHLDDGYYRLDAPDAAWASGANGVSFGGTVTGMVVIGSYHALVDFNPYDGVRLGLTALPNVDASSVGGLMLDSDIPAIADAVWDELYTPHQFAGTFGRLVADLYESLFAASGTVDSTGATASSFRTDIVADDDFYNDMLFTFTGGALAGQTRPVTDFAATNGVFTFDEPFSAAPANGVAFKIIKSHVHPISQIQSGLATSTELAKVPKSDGTVTWNATALASINAEADTALSDYGALKPTTAGRTLDVTATGAAGVDWSNVENPTTTVDLSGTTISTSQAVASVSGAVGSVTGSIGSLATQAKADVNAEADAALADINLDHLVKSAVDTNFATTVHLDSVIGQLADDGTTATFDRTTDSQEAIRNRGDSAWTTATGFSTLDAAGVRTAVGLASANLDTQLEAIPTAAENRAEIDSNSTQLAAIVADTNELQADWANGGRLDLILDARASQTSVNTAQADLDILTGSDGVTLATSQPNYAPATASALTTVGNNVAAILADTGTDGVVISQSTREAIADTVLSRGVDNVEDSADPLSLTEIALCIFESARSGTTWTIRKSDGTTFSTRTLTVDADADPITGVT